jgi:hypothetical protein
MALRKYQGKPTGPIASKRAAANAAKLYRVPKALSIKSGGSPYAERLEILRRLRQPQAEAGNQMRLQQQ